MFGATASAALRSMDVLARWGGEEFLLLMPHTPLEEGLRVIERVRREISRPEVWQARPEIQVTFSAGMTAHRPGETMMQAVARADDALYAAKKAGRDRTVVAPDAD